jgi:hypothetical protein
MGTKWKDLPDSLQKQIFQRISSLHLMFGEQQLCTTLNYLGTMGAKWKDDLDHTIKMSFFASIEKNLDIISSAGFMHIING